MGARRAALRLLDAVLRRGQPLESALKSATADLDNPADRGLAHALAATVLRWLPDIDALIDSATRQPLPDDAKARMALRIALAQSLRLGTPGHAAIATVLPLVDGGPRKLVHGVFGTLDRKGAKLVESPSLPPSVQLRWDKAWGADMTAAAAAALAEPPPLDLTLKDLAATSDWAAQLGGASLMPGHVRLPFGARIEDLPGFAEGAWWVQDLSASLPARLLDAKPGDTALDLCAAPGGKTMQLASVGARVTAVEANPNRLARLRENLKRTGLAADLLQADIMKWQPDGQFDHVLLDAPCSATGIFRRHPDVLYRVRPSDIVQLAATQAAMLQRAAQWVKPGGTLIYCVCSLEPEEGEGQIDALESLGLRVETIAAGALPAGLPTDASGCIRTLPGMVEGGLDGFFIARLRRTD